MLKVSGLTLSDLNKSDQTDQVKKIFKYVADISRKIEEKHQVTANSASCMSKSYQNHIFYIFYFLHKYLPLKTYFFPFF